MCHNLLLVYHICIVYASITHLLGKSYLFFHAHCSAIGQASLQLFLHLVYGRIDSSFSELVGDISMDLSIISQKLGREESLQPVLLELLSDKAVMRCYSLMAFVTYDGLLRLGIDPGGVLETFAMDPSREFHWVVGVDNVTTADALIRLRDLQNATGGRSSVRAFSDRDRGLFHPKLFIFERRDNTGTVIVGSNNLTPGGLVNNVEIAVILDNLSASAMQEWNEIWQYVSNLPSGILQIDDILIRNVRDRNRREASRRREQVRLVGEEEPESTLVDTRVLVRYISGAGGRTTQVHFSLQKMHEFFRLHPGDTRTISVQMVQPGELPEQLEPPRRLVYSQTNRNPKIEMRGVRRLPSDYPAGGYAVLIIQEMDRDRYRYMISMPGESGYHELSNHLDRVPQHGKSLKEDILTINELLGIWPDYPI